ncbi:hypothetical protein [Marinibactrum halimedae]|uniref:Uncharacterized protein n=1 Tax=Marinibactrum halimedae TaxID=1444977 RepID=A0AA37TA50_9GAMM|nr:hypothetical protein [Marinibactrum halimedae]MCD9460775.1 hypothetical protein [Marinibactrum halimedae]GLS26651.1 hypothetical protein GCM10007877_23680 [Marinibactrum halimedae]
MLNKLLFLICLLIFTGNTFANNVSTAQVKIVSLTNWVSGKTLLVKTDETSPLNPANCSFGHRYHLAEKTSDISRSLLLSAFMANRPVQLTIYGQGCSSDRPQIVAVSLPQ